MFSISIKYSFNIPLFHNIPNNTFLLQMFHKIYKKCLPPFPPTPLKNTLQNIACQLEKHEVVCIKGSQVNPMT